MFVKIFREKFMSCQKTLSIKITPDYFKKCSSN